MTTSWTAARLENRDGSVRLVCMPHFAEPPHVIVVRRDAFTLTDRVDPAGAYPVYEERTSYWPGDALLDEGASGD